MKFYYRDVKGYRFDLFLEKIDEFENTIGQPCNITIIDKFNDNPISQI